VTSHVVLLPGDGIGPEVVDAAAGVLRAVARRFGRTFELRAWPIGGAALRAGRPALPPDTLRACRSADAILLGAVGDPEFDAAPRHQRPESGLLALRRELGVFANLRPARVWPQLADAGPLKPDVVAGTDLFIVRELTGGLYFGEPRGLAPDGRAAVNTLRYSREEIERVAEIAFRAAAGRRRKVTSVDKANVLETSELWRSVVTDVARGFPDVTLEHMYVDACAMSLALEPRRFDVIVTENLFGDILSDEAGAITGSLGLLPSASLGPGPGLFEPVHGSAPSLAGRDVANPIGAIASAAMLLRYGLRAEAEAAAVEDAIGAALSEGCRTADIAPAGRAPIACSQMASAIGQCLLARASAPA
jgi:3-isopropylmalate dehydrogenase